MLTEDRITWLDQYLGFVVDELDLPRRLQERAVAIYGDLGRWLVALDIDDNRREPDVYVQGGFALGVVIRPISETDDYDIDLVYVRPIAKESTSQEQLKREAGDRLVAYQKHLCSMGKDAPRLVEKDRCWALEYPNFHVDVLPAIPQFVDDPISTQLLISDRALRLWQETDPKAYIQWFIERSRLRSNFDETANRKIEAVPRWEDKTPLQRAVQLAKRHRDMHFADKQDCKPPSILIVTLAAQAYQGEPTLAEAFCAVACRMRRQLEERGGHLWVSNPVNASENLARKLALNSELTLEFITWLETMERLVTGLGEIQGIHNVRDLLVKALGERPVLAATERMGRDQTARRDAGLLRIASGTGTLGTAGAVVVPRHTFHGDPRS